MKRDTIWTKSFILVMILNFLCGVVGMMTLPLVLEYAKEIGAGLTLASTAASLMSFVSLVICPFAGYISDRFDRKKILLICSAGYGIFLMAHMLASNIAVLMFCRVGTGIFFSLLSVTNMAFSTIFIPRARMGEGLGYAALANILAQAVGPAVGLGIADSFGNGMAFFVAGCIGFSCIPLLLLLREPKQVKTAASASNETGKKINISSLFEMKYLNFMLMAMLFSSANGLITTYIRSIASERAIGGISVFFTVYSVAMVILRPMTGKLLDKKGVYFLMIPSVIFAAAGMLCIGFGATLVVMLLGSLCKAFGQGAGAPSLQAYVVKKLPAERAGVASSTIQIGQNLGNAVAPILGSFVVSAFNYETMFAGAGVVILVVGLLLLGLQYRKEQKIKEV